MRLDFKLLSLPYPLLVVLSPAAGAASHPLHPKCQGRCEMPAPSLRELPRQRSWRRGGSGWEHRGAQGHVGSTGDPRCPVGLTGFVRGSPNHHLLTDMVFTRYLSNSARSPALPVVGSMLSGSSMLWLGFWGKCSVGMTRRGVCSTSGRGGASFI